MKDAAARSMIHWVRIVLGIPIIGYIYSPFDKIPRDAVMLFSEITPKSASNVAAVYDYRIFLRKICGAALIERRYRGHVVRRLISKPPARTNPANSEDKNPRAS